MKKKENKWLLRLDNVNRDGYLICPVCRAIFNYNILNTPSQCPECKSELKGIKKEE